MDFFKFFEQFLGLDGPYLVLLSPLLASLASGLTPSTRRNPVSTRSKKNRPKQKSAIVFGHFTPQIRLGWPQNHHKKIRLEIPHLLVSTACQTEVVVQFMSKILVFLLVCITSLHSYLNAVQKKRRLCTIEQQVG